MKDITLLIAHCDDELLFAWPILDRVKRIVCVSSDEHNPERLWCAKRKFCLLEVAKTLGLGVSSVAVLDYNSEFYRLPTRDETLKQLCRGVSSLLLAFGDPVFVHNAWGEYGNIDHILCHHIARITGLPMLVSDIAQEINWLPIRPWQQGELISRHKLDREWFDELKHIYDARGCWTWSHEPVTECSIYRV